ncbi:MAG TPA: hypothetical protein VF916_04565, partial [Ktedonobacterales bacterium]
RSSGPGIETTPAVEARGAASASGLEIPGASAHAVRSLRPMFLRDASASPWHGAGLIPDHGVLW